MKVCVTIAETSPGSYRVIKGPDTDIMAHKRLISGLARTYGRGPRSVMILTSSGVDRRARLNLPSEKDGGFAAGELITATKKKGRPRKK